MSNICLVCHFLQYLLGYIHCFRIEVGVIILDIQSHMNAIVSHNTHIRLKIGRLYLSIKISLYELLLKEAIISGNEVFCLLFSCHMRTFRAPRFKGIIVGNLPSRGVQVEPPIY